MASDGIIMVSTVKHLLSEKKNPNLFLNKKYNKVTGKEKIKAVTIPALIV